MNIAEIVSLKKIKESLQKASEIKLNKEIFSSLFSINTALAIFISFFLNLMNTIDRIYPKSVKENYKRLFIHSRINVNKETFLSFFLILSLLGAVIVSFLLRRLFETGFFLVFLILFIVLQFGFYFTLSLKADANGRFVESILPDALHLMTSNLRAGLTIDKALLLSARPEFGIFSEEMNGVGKKLTLGEDIGKALIEMTDKIRSDQFSKTISLIVSGLKSGGELASLLDHVSRNLRQKMLLEEKMRTNILMYYIFIFAAISFGAPILFGFSSFLINVIEKNLALVEIPKTSFIPISFSSKVIPSAFVLNFSIISLITTSTLGSLILGLMKKGNERAGVKYIPLLIFMSLSVFFLARYLVKVLLGGLFGL